MIAAMIRPTPTALAADPPRADARPTARPDLTASAGYEALTPWRAGPADVHAGLTQGAVDRAGRDVELGGQPAQRPAVLVETNGLQ